jgi:hypothetical protein
MPRSPTNYSLPPGTTPQQPNTVIGSAMFNSFADDVAQTFNTVTPVEFGGNGVTDNKPLANSFGIRDNTDLTKLGVFNATGIPTASTLTYALPATSGTLALTSGVGCELIQTISAAGATFVDFTAIRNSEFGSYLITGTDLQPNAATQFLLFRIMDGVSPVQIATSVYFHQSFRFTSVATGTGGPAPGVPETAINLHPGEAMGNGAPSTKSRLTLFMPDPAVSNNKQPEWTMGGLWESGSTVSIRGDGYIASTAVTTGFRIFFSGGAAFSGGVFRLYGFRK